LVETISGIRVEEIKLDGDNINVDISKTGLSGFKLLETTADTNQ
jgi:hypothetical protein